MGGRGSSSGMGGRSPQYKESYDIEMENAKDFEGYYALEKGTTKEALGYQMYVHKDVTGRSLIADTRAEMEELQRAHRTANRDGKSYGMSQQAIDGMKAAIKEKIDLHQRAIKKWKQHETSMKNIVSRLLLEIKNQRGGRESGCKYFNEV